MQITKGKKSEWIMTGYKNEDAKTQKIPQLLELLKYIRSRLSGIDWYYADLCAFISPDNTSQYELKYTVNEGKPIQRIRFSEYDQARVDSLFIKIREYFTAEQLPRWNKAKLICYANNMYSFDYYFDALYAWLEQLDKNSASYNQIPVEIELKIHSYTGLTARSSKGALVGTLQATH